ncbi:MAG: hypothetical protein ACOX69_07775 [Coriobacteriales bacterium]|jgi:hypothetical protein
MGVQEEDKIYTGWGLLTGWEDKDNPPYAAMKGEDEGEWKTTADCCGAVIAEGLPYREAVYEGQKLVNKYCPNCGKYQPTFHYERIK